MYRYELDPARYGESLARTTDFHNTLALARERRDRQASVAAASGTAILSEVETIIEEAAQAISDEKMYSPDDAAVDSRVLDESAL